MPADDQNFLEFIRHNSWLIGSVVMITVLAIETRFRVLQNRKDIDEMKATVREDMKEIRDDIKTLLQRIPK